MAINMPIYSLDSRTYTVNAKLNSKPEAAKRRGGQLRVLRYGVYIDGGVRMQRAIGIDHPNCKVQDRTMHSNWHSKTDVPYHFISINIHTKKGGRGDQPSRKRTSSARAANTSPLLTWTASDEGTYRTFASCSITKTIFPCGWRGSGRASRPYSAMSALPYSLPALREGRPSSPQVSFSPSEVFYAIKSDVKNQR